ncbi:MAG: redoxin domain-containing protein [Eubacteriaceae bacterium]|nr:redoxin domain-containing protein [Eubacteriaceae bacterium]
MNIQATLPVMTIFAQGLISFFSPCVLPLIPLYLGYLSGEGQQDGPKNKRNTMVNTIFFVLGISVAFLLLGLGATALGNILSQWRSWIVRLGGALIVLFGLFQLGLFKSKELQKERRFQLPLEKLRMNPITAFLFGFVFSFAWTPCVGPILASVLLMVGSSATMVKGLGLTAMYTLGFIVPFLLLGLFTEKLLPFFSKRKKDMDKLVKAGGVLLILIGTMMLTGWMNGITGYLSTPPQSNAQAPPETSQNQTTEQNPIGSNLPLQDQNGVTRTLSEYKGKVVFLNFWATWCPPCRGEIPDIEKIYQQYGLNEGDVAVLSVVSPGAGREGSVEDIQKFIQENDITYPVLMDTNGEMFAKFQVRSLPTTFIVTKNGEILGHIPGAMSQDMMKNIVEQGLASEK